jgi:hypothetical protein
MKFERKQPSLQTINGFIFEKKYLHIYSHRSFTLRMTLSRNPDNFCNNFSV